MLLGDTVAKVCASPRNSTWFIRLFLLVRGWGLGTRLDLYSEVCSDVLQYVVHVLTLECDRLHYTCDYCRPKMVGGCMKSIGRS